MDDSNNPDKCHRNSGGAMIYDFVPFHLVAEEIAKNLENHYDDVDLKDDYGRPNLDWDSYLQLSLAGRCKVATVRKDEKLIGYSCFCISNNLNHRGIIEASNSGIFIDKEYRGKITLELIRKSDEYLKAIGVMETIYIFNDDRIGILLRRAKYKAKHTVWSNKYGDISSGSTSLLIE